MLEKLKNTNVDDVNFTPFSYQARPSLPVRHDGPGKWVIVVLSALTGGMIACGGVLLNHAMISGQTKRGQGYVHTGLTDMPSRVVIRKA